MHLQKKDEFTHHFTSTCYKYLCNKEVEEFQLKTKLTKTRRVFKENSENTFEMLFYELLNNLKLMKYNFGSLFGIPETVDDATKYNIHISKIFNACKNFIKNNEEFVWDTQSSDPKNKKENKYASFDFSESNNPKIITKTSTNKVDWMNFTAESMVISIFSIIEGNYQNKFEYKKHKLYNNGKELEELALSESDISVLVNMFEDAGIKGNISFRKKVLENNGTVDKDTYKKQQFLISRGIFLNMIEMAANKEAIVFGDDYQGDHKITNVGTKGENIFKDVVDDISKFVAMDVKF
jgi:hypothetical protein